MLKSLLYNLGIDIRLVRNLKKAQKKDWEEKQDQLWGPFLAHHNIKTIIDVGANEGQFARLMQRHFPQATIFSFEPLDVCEESLTKVLSHSPNSKIYKVAVGDKAGVLKMNRSEFTPCSSLLSGTELLGEDYPNAADIKTFETPIVRLDDCFLNQSLEPELLVKFDVQGFEIPAIQGALETLEKASTVVIETCFFRRLYQGQPLFHEIYTKMYELGFSYMGNAEQQKRRADGRIVEADAIFERL